MCSTNFIATVRSNKVKFLTKLLDCVGRQVKNFKIDQFEIDKHKLIFVTSWLRCRFEVLRQYKPVIPFRDSESCPSFQKCKLSIIYKTTQIP